jgi:galactokinase
MPELRERPQFTDVFGGAPDAAASAPGRVNLIGEHTDYHDGFVLPTVLPQRTTVQIRGRADRIVRAWSASMPAGIQVYELGRETARRGWIDYVQGTTALLDRRGIDVMGFDLHITSTLPVGAGVSSSAALEIALLRALRQAGRLALDDVEIARVAQQVETDFVGAPIGIMDQMACSVGRDGEALFLDTRTLQFERVPLPASTALVVIDSGITHAHAGGEYAIRRRESFEAAARLGVDRLRDLGIEAMPQIDCLPEPLARRARHIVTENQRVIDAVVALKAGDVKRLGDLFNQSHVSMRDDYQTSTAEIDALVAIAQSDADIHGARLTGGGFGGCVVMLAPAQRARAAGERILSQYERSAGRRGSILVPQPV